MTPLVRSRPRRARRGGVRTLVVLLLATCTMVGADRAGAHETPPTVTPVVDGFEPAVSGVVARVRTSGAATLVELEVAPGPTVEVLDDDGRPWARITSEQTEVDVTNPSYHASTNAGGTVPDPLPSPDDPWVVVGRGSTFQWFDHRLHPPGLEVASAVLGSAEERDVVGWRVPLRIDSRAVNLLGRLRHVPVTGRVLPRLTSDREVAPGVTVEVAAGPVPEFFVRNAGNEPVTVLAPDGSPYAVLDTQGTRVNVASSTWQEQQRLGRLGDAAGAGVPTELTFLTVSDQPAHEWLDLRAALPGAVPAAEVRTSGREQVLRAWSIPVDVGGRTTDVTGELVWQPLAGQAARGTALGRPEYLVAAVAALALAGLLLLRARRRSGTGPATGPDDGVAVEQDTVDPGPGEG